MMETPSPSKPFIGIRFVLFGFDTIGERQVRAKLIDGGGVDTVEYSENCTHVIVDKVFYNDPVCISARNDGKTLITGLWVDHSYDIGMAVDATSIMYRPLRDLNGIPGAKSLVVCLTGYQRQDRDDIMTMVGLMGAQFSKPLVANKVTHLVCYKFEGEKYELAYKLKKIKLVNHRWLEDCLRDWELLPEDDYSKSGYELEMMEAEAKDSDEDADDTNGKQSSRKITNKSPQLKIGTPITCQMHIVNGDGPNISHNISDLEGSPDVNKLKDMLVTSSRMDSNNLATAAHTNRGSAVRAYHVTNGFNDATSVEKTPISSKEGNDLESVSRSYERPRSDAKFSATSYSRKPPRKSPSPIFSGQLSNIEGSSTTELGQSINISSAKVECTDLNGSYKGDILKGSQQLITEGSSSKKQKLDASCSNLGDQTMILDARESVTSISGKIQRLESVTSVHGQPKINNLYPLVDHDGSKNEGVSLDAALHTDVPAGKSSELQKKPVSQSPLSHEDVTQITNENESMKEKTSEAFYKGLINSSLTSNPEDLDVGVQKSEHVAVEAGLPLNQQQNKQVPSPCNSISETEKPQANANSEELKERNDNLSAKPGRKKTIAKRTLGARPKLKSTANQKGSIYLNKAAAQNNRVLDLSGERTDHKNSCCTELETSAETVNISKDKEADAITGMKSGDNNGSENNFMDDETEAPKDKDGPVDVFNLEKLEVANLSNKVHGNTENMSECPEHAANNNMDDNPLEEKNDPQILHKDESTRKGSGTKEKASKGRKQASGKTKTVTVPPVSKLAEPEKVVEEEKGKLCSAGQSKSRPLSRKNIRSSREVDKENEPILDGNQNISQAKAPVGKGDAESAKFDKLSTKVKQQPRKSNSNCIPSREVLKHVKSEPVWFILSGHRLQRKEFQQVIKRLKGKICRDSHHWSYQATHFIAPDPIRRTEKFFAAAASGRWILKTDYLSACSQAGKFLTEEQFEWHKNGLSEDGAINLEAPRKWRLLREKTGHGAFYGMRIIIYGECIAPPLDTLKRVVKAGDGTILATSPPYTRYLTTGVDYAIVSPGMPRVDMWVQEFLQHEIPCVVPDYLVEYVCKPGYSLDRHVLYNTHALAEKSFANLLRKAEEIVQDFLPSDNSTSSNDIACEVCGSRHRGDVMLICGDESGSVGCGKAMHIDCCDPPLKEIPAEDWFCPSCRSSNSLICKRRKGSSSVSN